MQGCVLVVTSVQPQFHLYSGNSCKNARNSHPRGTPKLDGSAVKLDADRSTLKNRAIFDSRPALTRAIRQAYF